MDVGTQGARQPGLYSTGTEGQPAPFRREHPGKRPAEILPAPTTTQVKKARVETVNKPSYDAFFVDNDREFSDLAGHLLARQQTAGPDHQLAVIQGPEDLHQGSLLRELNIDAHGVPKLSDGLLFSDTPVTLLIDFRQFPPARIPELNELFEKPARLQGRELGGNVRVVTVISPQMLPAGEGQPGPDFWWRINGTCPPRQASDIVTAKPVGGQDEKGSLQTWLDQNIVEQSNSPEPMESLEPINSGSAPKVIDFTGRDWHSLLFGTPGVDNKGQLVHQPGALERLKPGQMLTLKNAPWQDQAFAVQLARTLQSGAFRCNGSNIQLPGNLKLFRQPLSRDEIKAMARSVQWQTADRPAQNPALINKDNFAQIMHENVLTPEGRICRRDMLAQWLKGCDGIRITSALTQDQWLQLVSRLKEAGLQHLCFSTDVPQEQPLFFRGSATGTGPAAEPMVFAARVSIEHYDSNSELPLSASGPMEEFVILPEQSLTKIAQRTEITSLQKREFHCSLTHLVDCLRNGTPVCLSGLQSNPVLLCQLETLLCSPPHLTLFGQRETFPNMRLTITWPKDRTMPSPLWQAYANSFATEQTAETEVVMDQDSPEHQAFTAFRKAIRHTGPSADSDLLPGPATRRHPAIIPKSGEPG